jgi:hypothetical protein
MTNPQKQPLIECITPVGQANYVFIANPKQDDENKDKYWYSLMLAWPKEYMSTQLIELRTRAADAARQFFGGNIPPLEPFIRDGDNPAHNTSNNEDLKGKVYLNIKCKCDDPLHRTDMPGIVDAYGSPILPVDIYSGAFVRCSVLLGGYNNKGKRGVWVRLQNIQKSHDGERLSGRPSAQSQFGALNPPGPQVGGNDLL